MNPGGGSGWDEPPLDIQIPDDARELDRDVLAYHRELRARRRRSRLRRLAGPFGHGNVMPLLASILAVCLVAGAMLSVATFSPATSPAGKTLRPTTAASTARPAAPPSSAAASAKASAAASATGGPSKTAPAKTRKAAGRATVSRPARPSASPAPR